MAMFLAVQMKAARALLEWNQTDLAEKSGVALPTIKRMESSEGMVRGNAENVWKIQQTLEKAGIEFIPENGGGAGVRLKKG